MATAPEPIVRPWYDYAIGRTHDAADNAAGGELGVDLSTPQNTPITTPWSGVVTYAGSNASTGGIVKIASNLPGVGQLGEYFLHLNALAVHPGDTVQAGQVVGLSGGTQPGAGGWPHVEYGLFQDVAKYGGQYWGFTTGSTLDPTGFINSLHTSGGVDPSILGGLAGTAGLPNQQTIGQAGSNASNAAGGAITVVVRSSLDSLLGSLPGVSGSSDFLWRAGLIVLGVSLIIVGVLVTIWPAAKRTGQAATQGTVAAAKVAAVAA
jgi:hypothetical protein